jgi:hypothetical protein
MASQYLWGFNSSATTGGISPDVIALPRITPTGGLASNFAAPGKTPQTNLINVVRDFYWTYSPVGDVARAETPRIVLTERKLRTNALVAQLKYSLGQTYSGAQQVAGNLQLSQFLNSLADGYGNTFVNPALGKEATTNLKQFIQDTSSTLAGDAKGVYANTNVALQNFFNNTGIGARVKDVVDPGNDNNPTVNKSPWLSPYKNLYLTDPTGWVYVLPYFNNNHANQGNDFMNSAGDSTGSPLVQGLIGAGAAAITGAAGLIASLNNPAQITFIEKTKYYNYPTEGEDITVEFPLINTGQVSYSDVVKNWQFLFLLLYQNRPGKTSANTVDQPVIYQVEVPGAKFFPYCFIQSLNIEFMGSRREMNINIPVADTVSSDLGAAGQDLGTAASYQSIPAIIPDAYKVTISLKSMLANSKNFMQHMIGPHSIVEARTAPTTAPTPVTLPTNTATNPVQQLQPSPNNIITGGNPNVNPVAGFQPQIPNPNIPANFNGLQ